MRRWERAGATAAGLLAGVALDQAIGDPRRGHPVAAFGSVASWLERRMWGDGRLRGAAFTGILVGSAAALGIAVDRACTARDGRGPGDRAGAALRLAGATATGTWAVLGGRTLGAEAMAVHELLARGDLAGARRRLTHLVGRRTESLGEGEIARAVIESVAENTSDAIVAPLLWGAVAGLPGLLAYRAVNTLDAMVGHHSPRYERFGWASARLDDIANYLPARLTGLLTAAVAPAAGGSAGQHGAGQHGAGQHGAGHYSAGQHRGRAALATCRRDGRRHPSPNSGVCESAFAGALGVRLGGRNDYGSRVEERPVLGAEGKPAAAADIGRAVRLSRAVTLAAAVACAAVSLGRFGAAMATRRHQPARAGHFG